MMLRSCVAELSDRSRDPLVQFLVGSVLSGLRYLQSVEVRFQRVIRKQRVFRQVNAARSHFCPPKHWIQIGYKFLGTHNDARFSPLIAAEICGKKDDVKFRRVGWM